MLRSVQRMLTSRVRLQVHAYTQSVQATRKYSSNAAPFEENHIKSWKEGQHLGRILIDRPKALNAMSADMVQAQHNALIAFSADESIGTILIEGTSRAFCAGGDIKSIRESVLHQPYESNPPEGHPSRRVFQTEYNQVIDVSQCPVPYISLCHGVWMGFGTQSAHGDVRVVTEQTVFAMPECSIGLFPDVGFAHLAARMPGAVGLYLALTGKRLSKPADLLSTGIATHFVRAERLPQLSEALALRALKRASSKALALSGLEPILQQFDEADLGESELEGLESAVDACFLPALQYRQLERRPTEALDALVVDLLSLAQSTEREKEKTFAVEALESLQRQCPMSMAVTLRHYSEVHQAAQAVEALESLQRQCPNSMAVTLRHYFEVHQAVQIGSGPRAGLQGVMEQEYALAVRMVARPDFAEGVRAQVIDKDKNPRWQPSELADISDESLDAIFSPMPNGEGLNRDYLK